MGHSDLNELQTAQPGHHTKVFCKALTNLSTSFYVKLYYYLARLPIATNQIVVGTTMLRCTRQSKRPRPTDSKEEASSSGSNKVKKLSTRVSSRNLDNCIEFGIPDTLCCSSCQKYFEIDERKRKNRHEYTHHSFQCWKPYKDDPNV